MMRSIEYKILTDEEAIWQSLRNSSRTLDQIMGLRKGDILTVEYRVTITVDPEVAKKVAKEYIAERWINENSNN